MSSNDQDGRVLQLSSNDQVLSNDRVLLLSSNDQDDRVLQLSSNDEVSSNDQDDDRVLWLCSNDQLLSNDQVLQLSGNEQDDQIVQLSSHNNTQVNEQEVENLEEGTQHSSSQGQELHMYYLKMLQKRNKSKTKSVIQEISSMLQQLDSQQKQCHEVEVLRAMQKHVKCFNDRPRVHC